VPLRVEVGPTRATALDIADLLSGRQGDLLLRKPSHDPMTGARVARCTAVPRALAARVLHALQNVPDERKAGRVGARLGPRLGPHRGARWGSLSAPCRAVG
jgi:hypothetical protein